MESAFVEFFNAFDNISQPVTQLTDLSDGIILFEVLADIDPKWFKLIRSADVGDNWVLKYNNLKKLHKMIQRFYEENLGVSIHNLETPNLNAIAKDGDIGELLKLCQLVVALSVQCDNNQIYIEKIQGLSERSQHGLMLSIEQVMKRLNNADVAPTSSTSDERNYQNQDDLVRLIKEKTELEQAYQQIIDDHGQLRYKYDEIESEKDDLKSRLREMERAVAHANETGRADMMMRTEIDHLKQDLSRAEDKRLEFEHLTENQTSKISELERKVEELSKRAEEARNLRDQLDEYKHTAERRQKTENVIEKYKKKLEEYADLRRQTKALEEQNNDLLLRNTEMEHELHKVKAFKTLMDNYKEQVAVLETKNRELLNEKNRLDYELKSISTRLDVMEIDKTRDAEQIGLLEDRIRELELGGEFVDNITRQNTTTDDDEDTNEGPLELEDALKENSVTELKLKVTRLERQIKNLKEEKGEVPNQRAVVLQHMLEDANRVKARFEQDYLQAHQEKLVLERDLYKIKEGIPAAMDDKSELTMALRAKILDMENETGDLKVRLAEAEVKLQHAEKGLKISQADLTLLTKEQLEQAGPGLSSEVEKLTALQERCRDLEETNARQLSDINSLLQNRDALQHEYSENKEMLAEKERINSELKAALAALNTTDGQDLKAQNAQLQQKVTALQEEMANVQLKMQKAKEFIKTQDKLYKDNKAHQSKEDYEEAITSLKSEIKFKEDENNRLKKQMKEFRNQSRVEQQLIISAWYNMGHQAQRDNLSSQKMVSPTAWIGKQRGTLDNQLKRR